MRNIWLAALMLFNAVFMATPAYAAAPVSKPANVIGEAITKAFPKPKMTVADIIANLRKEGAPEDYVKEIETRTKEGHQETIEYNSVGKNKFALKSQGNELLVEIVNLDEGVFKINNRKVTLDFYQNPAYLWEDLQKAVEKKTAMNPLMALLLPEAQAISWWVIGLAGVAAIGLYAYGSSNCKKWSNLASRCLAITDTTSNEKKCALGKDVVNHDKFYKVAFLCGTVSTTGESVKDYARNNCGITLKAACHADGTATSNDQKGVLKGYN